MILSLDFFIVSWKWLDRFKLIDSYLAVR